MKLQILQVPDCPNVAVLAARLAELAGAWPDITVTHEIVTTAHDARQTAFGDALVMVESQYRTRSGGGGDA